MRSLIYRRSTGAGTGRVLARALGSKFCTPTLRPKAGTGVMINYGCSDYPAWGSSWRWINHPHSIPNCVDKKRAYQLLSEKGVPTLEYTTNQEIAQQHCAAGKSVVVRKLSRASRGRGIMLIPPYETVPPAPLYTLLYDKTHEYRVHVINGEAVDVVQKKRLSTASRKERGIEQVNDFIRNTKGGWIYAHKDLLMHEDIIRAGVDAVKALGLDYGAVDVMARWVEGGFESCVVCEVNSAPLITSKITLDAYVDGFNKLIQEKSAC